MTRMNSFDTPILLLAFDRPDLTFHVFESIRSIQPTRLYLSCDGPRQSASSAQIERINNVKQFSNKVDWECEVQTLFHDTNQGCRLAVSTALNWFFEHEEKGIILEDDCVPSASFYPYCAQLLSIYSSYTTVGMISGNNIINSHTGSADQSHNSIVCSYGNIWGWATWRDRWQHFVDDKEYWSDADRISKIRRFIGNDKLFYVYNALRKSYISGSIDSWAVPWLFSRLEAHMLTINPAVNLVRNIGFNSSATHTDQMHDQLFCTSSSDLEFPLRLPKSLTTDDNYIRAASRLPFYANVKYYIKSIFFPGSIFR